MLVARPPSYVFPWEDLFELTTICDVDGFQASQGAKRPGEYKSDPGAGVQWAAKRWDAQNVSMLLKEFVDRNLLSTRKALRSLEHLSIRHHLRFVN